MVSISSLGELIQNAQLLLEKPGTPGHYSQGQTLARVEKQPPPFSRACALGFYLVELFLSASPFLVPPGP